MIVYVTLGIAGLVACDALQPKLDMHKIEKAVAQTATNEFRNASVASAKCPKERTERSGDVFDCTVSVEHQYVHYVIKQLDGHGRVDVKRNEPFVLAPSVSDQGRDLLRSRGIFVQSFTCNQHRVYFPNGTKKVQCKVAVGGVKELVYIATLDGEGKVSAAVAGTDLP